MIEKTINEEQKNAILKAYENDVRCEYSDESYEEWWIGEKGTTQLKIIIWEGNEGIFTECEISVDKLRANTHFLSICLTDSDVNHSLNFDSKKSVCTLDKGCAEDLFDWYFGKTDVMPITPCGMQNYCIDYFE